MRRARLSCNWPGAPDGVLGGRGYTTQGMEACSACSTPGWDAGKWWCLCRNASVRTADSEYSPSSSCAFCNATTLISEYGRAVRARRVSQHGRVIRTALTRTYSEHDGSIRTTAWSKCGRAIRATTTFPKHGRAIQTTTTHSKHRRVVRTTTATRPYHCRAIRATAARASFHIDDGNDTTTSRRRRIPGRIYPAPICHHRTDAPRPPDTQSSRATHARLAGGATWTAALTGPYHIIIAVSPLFAAFVLCSERGGSFDGKKRACCEILQILRFCPGRVDQTLRELWFLKSASGGPCVIIQLVGNIVILILILRAVGEWMDTYPGGGSPSKYLFSRQAQ